jgi:flagellar hook-associated protein FlgK
MWALVKSNKIEEIISSPKDMVIDDVRHPRALFSVWTDAERKAIGILPVTTSGTPLNSKYYIEKNEAFAIAGDKNSVVRTIGEKVADRKLDDEDAKDEDGKQLYEDDGITKIINYGLKTNAKRKATSDANGFCQGFNWLIQRKVTADTAIPSDVVTYMAAIRTDHKAICDAIDGASDMNAFIALHTDTYKEDGTVDVVARVNRWTDDKDVKQHRR